MTSKLQSNPMSGCSWRICRAGLLCYRDDHLLAAMDWSTLMNISATTSAQVALESFFATNISDIFSRRISNAILTASECPGPEM